MSDGLSRYILACFCLGFELFFQSNAHAAPPLPEPLVGVGITEHLGASLKTEDLHFLDESGAAFRWSDHFGKRRSLLIVPVYFQCANLCSLTLNGLLEGVKGLQYLPGQEFEIVAYSINPVETPKLAAEKKAKYIEKLNRPGAEKGWHFLTGDAESIRSLSEQIGFGFKLDVESGEFAHAATVVFVTPEGAIARYMNSIQFEPRDLKLAILESSRGQVGTLIDQALLFCFRYDPHEKGYSLAVFRVVQAASALLIILGGIFLFYFWSRQRA